MSFAKPKTAKPMEPKAAKKASKKSASERARFLAGEEPGSRTLRDPERSGVIIRESGDVKTLIAYAPIELAEELDIHLIRIGRTRYRSAWIIDAIREKLERDAPK